MKIFNQHLRRNSLVDIVKEIYDILPEEAHEDFTINDQNSLLRNF